MVWKKILGAISGSLISLTFVTLSTLFALLPILFFPILLPAMLVASFRMSYQHTLPFGWPQAMYAMSALCIQALVTPILWAGFIVSKIPVHFFNALHYGINCGWNNDIMGILSKFDQEVDRANSSSIVSHLYTLYERVFFLQDHTPSLAQQLHFFWLVLKSCILYSNLMFFDPREKQYATNAHIANTLEENLRLIRTKPTTPFFESLQLSCVEINDIDFNTQPLLTEEELENLNTSPKNTQSSDVELLSRYHRLINLHQDKCPIANDKPNKVILLIKQYKSNGAWHSVPHYSLIFDKDWLKKWYNINPVLDRLMFLNPLINDIPSTELLNQPLPYNQCETRFRYYSYTQKNRSVPNQELNELIITLRNKLSMIKTKEPSFDSEQRRHIQSQRSLVTTCYAYSQCFRHLFYHARGALEEIALEDPHQSTFHLTKYN